MTSLVRQERWSCQAGPFRVAEAIHFPNVELPRHSHPEACVHLILEGVYKEVLEERGRSFFPGTVLYKPPAIEHSNQFSAGSSRSLRIEVDIAAFRNTQLRTGIPADPFSSTHPTAVGLAHQIYRECMHQDAFTPLSVEGLCLELLALICRAPHDDACDAVLEPVLAATEIFRARFREAFLLSDIAKSLGVHRSVLSRAFRRHHRCTMGEFVHRLRVNASMSALKGTNLSLAQIAQEAGFADQSHFSRTFKRLVGSTPMEYRRQSSSSHRRSSANSVQDLV